MAVYPYTLRDTYETALASDEARRALRAAVAQELERGADRERLLVTLERLADELAEQGREADENVVLDVMDALVGRTHPSVRL